MTLANAAAPPLQSGAAIHLTSSSGCVPLAKHIHLPVAILSLYIRDYRGLRDNAVDGMDYSLPLEPVA